MKTKFQMNPLKSAQIVLSVLFGLLLSLVPHSLGQHRDRPSAHSQEDYVCVQIVRPSACRTIRVINDPATHLRWQLFRDANRPAGPGLLLLGLSESSESPRQPARTNLCATIFSAAIAPPIIHAGDRMVVSETTKVSDAQLEATALSAAAIGESITVRLKIGGRILHAIATGPGHASVVVESVEDRP